MARTLSDRSKESQPIKMPSASTTAATSTSAPVSAFGFAPAPPRPVFQTPVPLSHVAERSAPLPASSQPVQPQAQAQVQPELPPPTIDQLAVPEQQEALLFDPPSPFMTPQEIADKAEGAEVEGLVLAPSALGYNTGSTNVGEDHNKKVEASASASGSSGRGRGTGGKAKVGRKGKGRAIATKQGAGVGNHPSTAATRGRGRGGATKAATGRKGTAKIGTVAKARSPTKAAEVVGVAAEKGKATKVETAPAVQAVPEATTSQNPSATPAAVAATTTAAATERPVDETQTHGRSKRVRRVEPGRYAEPASPPPKKMKLGKGSKSATKKGGKKGRFSNDDDDEDKKRYVCTHPGCDKSFARNFNLNAHLDTHRGIRDYACHECGKLFSRRHDCTRHCVAVHNVDRETGKLEVLRVTPERAPHQKPGVQRQPSPFATSAAWANSGTAAARASGAGARKRKSSSAEDGKDDGVKVKKGKKAAAGTGKTGAAAQRFKRNEPNGHGSYAGFKTTGLPIRGRPRKSLAA